MKRLILVGTLLAIGVGSYILGRSFRTGPSDPQEFWVGQELPRSVVFSGASQPSILSELQDRVRGTVLFIFSLGCRSCDAEFAAWRAISGSGHMRFIGLAAVSSVAELEPLRKKLGGNIDLYLLDTQARSLLQVRAFPTIIEVNPQGLVEGWWVGEGATGDLKAAMTSTEVGK